MDFYRILIIPWPSYTDAFKKDRFNQQISKGSNIISGDNLNANDLNTLKQMYGNLVTFQVD